MSGQHDMRKVMEFPTEWTMPDPAGNRDNSPEEENSVPQQSPAVTPAKDQPSLAAGSASGK